MTETQPPNLLRRTLGLILLLTSIIGLILSGLAIAWVWQVQAPISARMLSDIELVQDALATTKEGLEITGDSLARVESSLMSIEESLMTLSTSMEDLEPLIVTLETFADQDIPDTIASTQTSLEVAQTSAKIIEDVLIALTAIPFFPGDPYAPEKPLHIALADVSTNLDDIPESLSRMATDLERTETNIVAMRVQLQLVISTVKGLQNDVNEAQGIVDAYKVTVNKLVRRVNNVEENLETWVLSAARGATLLLVWIALTQIGLMVNALSLLKVYL